MYVNATGQPGQDQSVASTLSVLPNVIEKSVRTLIAHGLAVSVDSSSQIAERAPSISMVFVGLYIGGRRDENSDSVRDRAFFFFEFTQMFEEADCALSHQKYDLEWSSRVPNPNRT